MKIDAGSHGVFESLPRLIDAGRCESRWFFSIAPRIGKFEETDLYLWVSIGLVIGRLDWTVWLLFGSQMALLAVMLVKRSLAIVRVDRRMREIDAG